MYVSVTLQQIQLGHKSLQDYFSQYSWQPSTPDTTAHREAYTNMQTNTSETNLRWQTAHHRKCKYTGESVSSKLAWGKETDSKRTKLYLCRYTQLRSHHHTLVSRWPTPTAYQEEAMESSCSSMGMSNACWRLSLEARGRMDVWQL